MNLSILGDRVGEEFELNPFEVFPCPGGHGARGRFARLFRLVMYRKLVADRKSLVICRLRIGRKL
jgi:hypothetical protein